MQKQKNGLAKQLDLSARQVEVWFQNRRARTKLKQTEADCELLKRCCESLTAENRLMMYVPRGFAHAILTLEPDTEALYLVSAHYAPQEERGVRWNDPRFAIEWPLAPAEISAKDAGWPDFDEAFHGVERFRALP